MSFFVENMTFWSKMVKKKLSSDPRDLSHELRAAPEVVGAAGDAQNGWMATRFATILGQIW